MTESTIGKKYCDLVMKGGVTSGIVYPLAVQKLSTQYWFKNIGGTSAGAIAAGVTAAAECRRRRTGQDDGFERLAKIPDDLAADSFLLTLFRPDESTKRVFQVVLAAMSAKQEKKSVWMAAVRTLFANFSAPVALAVLLVVIPTVLLAASFGGSWVPYVLLALLGCLITIPYFVLGSAIKETSRSLLMNHFGFCSGFDAKAPSKSPRLTNWIYSLLNEVSGQGPGVPLTFGDLWDAPAYGGETQLLNETRCTEHVDRAINFEVMTTNLTYGCPTRIPFDTKGYYFSSADWDRLFPLDVVEWMEQRQDSKARPAQTAGGERLVPLPEMRDLPIIVAIRMSLSFPILLTAVPLYTVDYSLKKNAGAATDQPITAEPCWFSDGGISSNFPIHFFDSPLPRWPTFGINLKPPHPDHNTEEEYVWLPSGNLGGLLPTWNRFEGGGLLGFAGAILNVMQNWRDNLQMPIPGYRDRIVHISHTDREGGLNLRMDATVITKMSERGRRAGEAFLTQFDWKNHGWIRYRSTMCCLETTLERLGNSYRNPLPEDSEVWNAIHGNEEPPSYQWHAGQAAWAQQATKELTVLAANWFQSSYCFCTGAPRPRPDMRITPKV
jgi:predicted acylesterase/phospholipase RssA